MNLAAHEVYFDQVPGEVMAAIPHEMRIETFQQGSSADARPAASVTAPALT